MLTLTVSNGTPRHIETKDTTFLEHGSHVGMEGTYVE